MNIVFIGSSSFGLRCLQAASQLENINISGVVTARQNFTISYSKTPVKNILHANFAVFCKDRNIPCEIMETGMGDKTLKEKVEGWKPDMFLVAGWYHMVPNSWRQIAPAYGLHASLLPDYSGGAPLVWAIINNEPKTGITFFQFDDGVDSGPIVAQGETPIHENDTIATLYARIEDIGIDLIRNHLPSLADRTAVLKPQNNELRRIYPQRSPSDGHINWTQNAKDIYNFIRAQTKPYPGAFTTINGQKLTIWSSAIDDETDGLSCGQTKHKGRSVAVGCGGESQLIITSASLDGEDLTPASITTTIPTGYIFRD